MISFAVAFIIAVATVAVAVTAMGTIANSVAMAAIVAAMATAILAVQAREEEAQCCLWRIGASGHHCWLFP